MTAVTLGTSGSATLWYGIRATGVVALVLLTLDTVLGLLVSARVQSRRWPGFAQVDLHKRVTVLTLVFLAVHVLGATLDTYVHVGLASIVVPFLSSYQPLWVGLGTVAVDLLAAVAISSALRRRIPPDLWRRLHWLAFGCWPFAMIHSLGAGTDAGELWLMAVAVVCGLATAAALVFRIHTLRSAVAMATAVGATTRAVPNHPRPPGPASVGRDRTGAGAPGHSGPGTSTRLLERGSR